MDWFFQSFQQACFSVHQWVFPVVSCCVYKEVIVVPEGWFDGELFSNGGDWFESWIGDMDGVCVNDGNFIITIYQTRNLQVFDGQLSQYFSVLNIVLRNTIFSCKYHDIFLHTAEYGLYFQRVA